MSFAVQNLAVFIELIKTQPALFSQENFAELEELIAPIPDDIDKISIAIAGWYQKHPNILNSQLELLKKYSNNSDSSLSGVVTGHIDKPFAPINFKYPVHPLVSSLFWSVLATVIFGMVAWWVTQPKPKRNKQK